MIEDEALSEWLWETKRGAIAGHRVFTVHYSRRHFGAPICGAQSSTIFNPNGRPVRKVLRATMDRKAVTCPGCRRFLQRHGYPRAVVVTP